MENYFPFYIQKYKKFELVNIINKYRIVIAMCEGHCLLEYVLDLPYVAVILLDPGTCQMILNQWRWQKVMSFVFHKNPLHNDEWIMFLKIFFSQHVVSLSFSAWLFKFLVPKFCVQCSTHHLLLPSPSLKPKATFHKKDSWKLRYACVQSKHKIKVLLINYLGRETFEKILPLKKTWLLLLAIVWTPVERTDKWDPRVTSTLKTIKLGVCVFLFFIATHKTKPLTYVRL